MSTNTGTILKRIYDSNEPMEAVPRSMTNLITFKGGDDQIITSKNFTSFAIQVELKRQIVEMLKHLDGNFSGIELSDWNPKEWLQSANHANASL